MKAFAQKQRVVVLKEEHGIALNALGTVERICTDGSAWIALDRRSRVERAHPFDRKDRRSTHVKANPEDCELATKNHKDRRAAKADAVRAAAIEDLEKVGMEAFGKDHWSTFAYIETVCVDNNGVPDRRRMRCVDARHPLRAHGHDASAYPTRLKEGKTIPQHDDWDCVDDLIRVGLLQDVGTPISPQFSLTDRGYAVASLLRRHKASGNNYATFLPSEGDILASVVVKSVHA